MKKNGFTLIELLAVIVVLAIIMSIAGSYLLGQRRSANVEEAKLLENTIAEVGPDVYTHELSNSSGTFMNNYKNGNSFKISADTLKKYGYISTSIENPSGNGTCDAYLVVDPVGDEMFTGYVDCENLYATGQSDDTYSNDAYLSVINDISAEVTELASY